MFESIWNNIWSGVGIFAPEATKQVIPVDTETPKNIENLPKKQTAVSVSSKPQTIYDTKYGDDMRTLEKAIGEIRNGGHLTFDLQDLLKILPKQRRRIDAYDGFKSALLKYKGVTLEIHSQKIDTR